MRSHLKHIMASFSDFRVLGAIFIIIGTCLGGGILVLPMTNAPAGLTMSVGYLILMWFVMTFCSWLHWMVELRMVQLYSYHLLLSEF